MAFRIDKKPNRSYTKDVSNHSENSRAFFVEGTKKQ